MPVSGRKRKVFQSVGLGHGNQNGGAPARARMNRGGRRARRNSGDCLAAVPECKVVDDAEASVKVRRTITKDAELSVSKRGRTGVSSGRQRR